MDTPESLSPDQTINARKFASKYLVEKCVAQLFWFYKEDPMMTPYVHKMAWTYYCQKVCMILPAI